MEEAKAKLGTGLLNEFSPSATSSDVQPLWQILRKYPDTISILALVYSLLAGPLSLFCQFVGMVALCAGSTVFGAFLLLISVVSIAGSIFFWCLMISRLRQQLNWVVILVIALTSLEIFLLLPMLLLLG